MDENEVVDPGVIPFDTGMSSNAKGRSHGGYGGFLFDKAYSLPDQKFSQEMDLSEAFFVWAEKFPIERNWEIGSSVSSGLGQQTVPYYYWKGLAKQMIVSLLQKYVEDVSDSGPRPENPLDSE